MENKFHAMPSVFVMEHDVPAEMVTNLNLYLDNYLKQKKRKSLASTLVGQIQNGQQLLMDHEDKKTVEFSNRYPGLNLRDCIDNTPSLGLSKSIKKY